MKNVRAKSYQGDVFMPVKINSSLCPGPSTCPLGNGAELSSDLLADLIRIHQDQQTVQPH